MIPFESNQYASIEFDLRCRDAKLRPWLGSVGDAYGNAMCESFFATLECELLTRGLFRTPADARSAAFTFIEGFYNQAGVIPRSGTSRRRVRAAAPAVSVAVGAFQPAAVLAAVLDRRCARRPHHRAGRDRRMAPPGAEPKNVSTLETSMPSIRPA
jgi:putative transposase